MNIPEYDYQVLKLTDAFFERYPHSEYPELMEKKNRGYNCLLIQTHYDFFICIPYRTEIWHRYAYHFKRSKRSRDHRSGLDYTKIVIINNLSYISAEDVIIDQDEYVETRNKIYEIVKGATGYLEDYIKHNRGEKLLDEREFARRYRYSTLKYFHSELSL